MVSVQEKVQCWFPNDASEPEVIEKKICECTKCVNSVLRYDKPTGYGSSGGSVGWGSNKAVTY